MEYTENKKKVSAKMMKWAWALEIIFCINGLFIALALSYAGLGAEGFSNLSTSLAISFAISLLAFGAIALTELIKIPVVQGILYSKSTKKKIFSSLFLVFICFLTFETMVTGLEQNIANREYTIENLRAEVFKASEKISLLDSQIVSLQTLSGSEIKKNAKDGLKFDLDILDKQINDLNERSYSLTTPKDTGQVLELKRQVDLLESKKFLEAGLLERRIVSLRNEVSSLDANEQKELSGSFFSSSIKAKYSKRRNSYLKEIETLNIENKIFVLSISKEINALNIRLIKFGKPSRYATREIQEIALTIKSFNEQKGVLIALNGQDVRASIKDNQRKDIKISSLSKEKDLLASQVGLLRSSINKEANGSFVHRMTARINGKDSAADLTKEEVSLVSLFFIISIALIAAISGPLLALLSVSNYMEETVSSKPNKSGMKGSLRKALISARKRFMRPKIVIETKEVEVTKEVIKEVPVEKIVYEIVRVPTPVEVSKFIGVPVPTNPTDLPKYDDLNHMPLMPLHTLEGDVK